MHSTYPGEQQPYPPQMTAISIRFTWHRMLTTLDVLSDGRLDAGVGIGWMKDEHDIARGAEPVRHPTPPRTGPRSVEFAD